MKILKIFGIVVGIHLAILIGVFVVPGCTSTTRPAPAAADTVTQSQPAPVITVPNMDAAQAPAPVPALAADPAGQTYGGFNPDAPATSAGGSSGTGIRFTPTRPNTAAASAVLSQPVSDVTPAATYSVKGGDSLWTIAKRNHLTVAELAAANNLRISSVLHQGQKLIIPAKATSTTRAAASAMPAPVAEGRSKAAESAPTAARSGEKTVTYTVKSGETLGQIARMFDVRQKDIAVANSISDPRNLRAGTVLVIPGGGWQKPAGKTSHSAAAATSAPAPAPTPSTPPNILDSDQTQPAPPPSNNVPVIKIDDNSSAPAPKP